VKNTDKPTANLPDNETKQTTKKIIFIGDPECYYSNAFGVYESEYDYQLVFSRSDLKRGEDSEYEHQVTEQVKITITKDFAKHIHNMLGKVISGDKKSLEKKKE
jgi:hypothetical protein